MVDSDSFRQPVVRSGGAVRRPAAPPRRTPFPEVESLVALVSPSPTKDASSIGDSNRNTTSGFEQDWKAVLVVVQTKSTRVRLMFALGYDAALRREELCSVQVHDIDPAHRTVRIRAEATKNRLERIVPYSIHTSCLYQKYLQERRALGCGRGALFLSASRRNRGRPLSYWMWSKAVKQLRRNRQWIASRLTRCGTSG